MSIDSSSTRTGKRDDIQLLRAYAVIIVILYHSGLGYISQGFIGVDVFFVISGYLITGHIRRDISAGAFSLGNFYVKRIKRLLPAAYATIMVSLCAAPFILSGTEGRDFGKQIMGAVGFISNYILKNQTGYFEGAADLKPLLHTWSLSVEEQFYFLIPPLLLLIPYRAHGLFVALITITSYLGCWFAKANPETVFYTLPYRAWELGLGALATFFVLPSRFGAKGRVASLLFAIVLLVYIPTINPFYGKKIVLTSIACLSTFLILLVGAHFKAKDQITRSLVGVGDISYSLYLVHWPLFSFYNNLVIGNYAYDRAIRLSLVVTSFIFAIILNKYVENRFLGVRAPNKKVVIYSILFGLIILASSKLYSSLNESSLKGEGFREKNIGLSNECSKTGPLDSIACRTSESPKYMVWGDSMAMQLVDGLITSRQPHIDLIQATRHNCLPLMGVSGPGDLGYPDFQWAKTCLDFNDEVLATLKRDSTINTVVLSGNLINLLKPDRLIVYRASDGTFSKEKSDPDRIYAALERIVTSLRTQGFRVVFVLAPPSASYDVGRCLARRLNNMPILGEAGDCEIDAVEYASRTQVRLDAFVAKLRQRLDLTVLGFDDTLCHAGQCKTVMDGIPLYRDAVHFTIEGGRAVIHRSGLLDEIDRKSH